MAADAKTITLDQILTPAQIKRCQAIYKQHTGTLAIEDKRTFAEKVCDEITKPNIAEISRKAGQEMDAKYVAYMVEYAFMQTERRRGEN